jgi:CheY-like chemotaxis protein
MPDLSTVAEQGIQKFVHFEKEPVIVLGENNPDTITEQLRALSMLFFRLEVYDIQGKEASHHPPKKSRTDALYAPFPVPKVFVGRTTEHLEEWMGAQYAAETHTPSLFLLDHNMPGRNGFYIAGLAVWKFQGVPVYMFSGNDKIDDIAREAGANGYVRKDDIVEPSVKRDALREIVERELIPEASRIQPPMQPSGLVHYL